MPLLLTVGTFARDLVVRRHLQRPRGDRRRPRAGHSALTAVATAPPPRARPASRASPPRRPGGRRGEQPQELGAAGESREHGDAGQAEGRRRR